MKSWARSGPRCCFFRLPSGWSSSSRSQTSPTSCSRGVWLGVGSWRFALRSVRVGRGWFDSSSPRAWRWPFSAASGHRAGLPRSPRTADPASAGVPPCEQITLDLAVLAFALAASLATGVLFGVLPALQAARARHHSALSEGSSGSGRARRTAAGRLRAGLVVAEIAVAGLLLVGGGILIRSFATLIEVDPAYDAANLLTAQLQLPSSRYSDEAQAGVPRPASRGAQRARRRRERRRLEPAAAAARQRDDRLQPRRAPASREHGRHGARQPARRQSSLPVGARGANHPGPRPPRHGFPPEPLPRW